MAAGKRSFILYADYLEMVSKLTDAKAGKLFKLILEYVNDRDPKTDELLLQIAFEPIKQNLKRDLKKWEGEKEDRSESGKLGNLKRWNKDLYDRVVSGEITLEASQVIAKHRKATKGIANVAVNDTVTVNVNDSVIVTERENTGQSSICIFDVEELISKNPIEFERICMAAKKNIQDARPGLRKYHLYLSEKELYPKSKKALFAGFEKWLMNEKNFEHGNTKINGSDKHKGAKQLITLIKQNYAAGGTEDPSS